MSTTARSPKIRAYAGPPVLLTTAMSAQYGSFHEVRERKGEATWGAYGEALLPAGLAARTRAADRLLTNDELWLIYRRCAEIRACIDEITRVVSTWDWCVEPVLDPADPAYEDAMEIARTAQTFLEAPNTDGETWQTVMSKLIRDLLIYDAMAAEQVLGRGGELEELVPLRGGDVQPVVDRHNHLLGYKQIVAHGNSKDFTTEEITYLNLFPNTVRPGGTPLIETLIDEILTMIRGGQSIRQAFDSDEVPPGILLLAGIASKAANRAVASLQNMAGNDQKLRVFTTDNPQGLKGEWLELRHTPKDLQYLPITKEVVRRIWRLFGVKPVTMGDVEAAPRATAEVQVDAQDSGLLLPITELIEAQINMRTLPLLVGNVEDAAVVKFSFDKAKRRTAQDEASLSTANGNAFDRGVITPNEWRRERGLAPYDASGDVPLIKQGGQYVRLDTILGFVDDDLPAPDEDKDAEVDTDTDAGTDTDASNPGEDDAAPGQAENASRPRPGSRESANRRKVAAGRARLRARRTALARAGWSVRVEDRRVGRSKCEPGRDCQHRESDADEPGDVPLRWSDDTFKGLRTMDLPKLARQIASYRRAVSPLWNRCRMDILAAFTTALRDGRISGEESTRLLSTINSSVDALRTKWSARTDPHYRSAAKIGRDAASQHGKQAVVADWRDRGEAYHDRAIAYLDESGGVLSDLRAQLSILTHASSRTPPAYLDTRAIDDDDMVARILTAVSSTFSRNVHRIANWGGRLVELANDVMVEGFLETESAESADAGGTGATTGSDPDPWYCEWVSVLDDATCSTCESEASQGFRPLTQVHRRPGGDTECRANDRCALVFWRKSEVDDGTAKTMNGRSRGYAPVARRPVAPRQIVGS